LILPGDGEIAIFVRQGRRRKGRKAISTSPKDAPPVLDGATVWLQYDAKDVASDKIVVEVITPDAKAIATTFDLKSLR
jgi:hypothetical protein